MLQEREGIKFNSIYFRYYLWILATVVMVMSIIIGADAYIGWGENRQIITVGQLCFILNITFSAIFIGCSFAGTGKCLFAATESISRRLIFRSLG